MWECHSIKQKQFGELKSLINSCILKKKIGLRNPCLSRLRRKMERNIKAYISIALGILFCGSVLIGYIPIPEYVIELTCMSNLFIGILLLFTGINMFGKKKKIPSVIYHMWLVTILLVCAISCIGHFNFHGVFFFLHLVNPFVFLVYYMVFIDDGKNFKKILLTPIPVMIYLIFVYFIGMLRGTFVYGIFEVNEMGFAVMFLVVCGVYISLLMIAAITQYINQKMRMLILVRR